MLGYSEQDAIDSAADEIYKVCARCGREHLSYYWDYELDTYIYLIKEDDLFCPKCIDANVLTRQ